MTRFELTVSPDYVPHWTEVEAIRELFQNALDSEGEMFWGYHEEDELFEIANTDTSLSRDTLLFGSTTKANDSSAIGNFGEGYKLAFLVLARLKHKVVVHNPLEKETWHPKIIKSKRYKSDLLVVDVEKCFRANKALKFQIYGITKEIFKKICKKNLIICPCETEFFLPTKYGNILTRSEHKGDIFINGLYVCTKNDLKYGYDVLPQYLETNRDRNLVSDFNIHWITSKIWGTAGKPAFVCKMIKDQARDVYYVDNFKSNIKETMYAGFVADHGRFAVPVTTQEEFDVIKQTYKKLKPVFVTPQEKTIVYYGVQEHTLSKAITRQENRSPEEILGSFLDEFEAYLPSSGVKKFEAIIRQSKDWTYK